ncbi:hypothetical protein HPP92_002673 [Vanilla planifolia]|uniref:Uncharacterized protein n=1 Tax=Vanilla planifolia TaxID=51239 RepID=A0A835VMZ3_VANPL|nr:hypothetical protein HPP92_002673 [Vanilla planifolia]
MNLHGLMMQKQATTNGKGHRTRLSTSKQIHEGMEVTELVMHNKIEEYETTKI